MRVLGPRFPVTPKKKFLDFEVNSRIGISAGLFLNSDWILAYAKLGFDILTYKTVRSAYRPCYPVPNWIYLNPPSSSTVEDADTALTANDTPPRGLEDLTSAV